MSRSIALAGMMGAGKTTVARHLGDALGRLVVDTDREVERAVGAPIPVIFTERGEPYFRAAEREVVRELARPDDLVLALGGGVVLDDSNVAELLTTGVIVYLETTAQVLIERLEAQEEAEGRPLLAGDTALRVRETLEARAPRYAEVADLVVDASRDPEVVTRTILDALLERDDVLTRSEHEQVMP